MKVILVPVADRPECEIALGQAFELASAHGGNVMGGHLHAGGREAGTRVASRFHLHIGSRTRPGQPGRAAARHAKGALRLFEKIARQHDFTLIKRARLGMEGGALWFDIEGDLDKLFAIVGPLADLSVVSRPAAGAHGQGSEFLLSALMHSGKPVLVLPQKRVKTLGKQILIAWNQSPEAARAVSAALPLLRRATSVTIVSCGPENQPGPKSANLVQYLKFWGVRSRRRTMPGRDVAEEIETSAREEGSDLVIMGAYSRSRMSEVVFGGVTERMLFRTRRPIFALHT